jgi:hypothetical protein
MTMAELRAVILGGTTGELQAIAADIGRETLREILVLPALFTETQCAQLGEVIASLADEAKLHELRKMVEGQRFAASEVQDQPAQRRIAELARQIDRRLVELRPPPTWSEPPHAPYYDPRDGSELRSPPDRPFESPPPPERPSVAAEVLRPWADPASTGPEPAPPGEVPQRKPRRGPDFEPRGDGFDWLR